MKKYLNTIITILILSVIGFGLYSHRDKFITKKEVKEVPTVTIKQEHFTIKIKERGTTDALKASKISSPLHGNVIELPIKEGSFVRKGDIILKFDSLDLERELLNKQLEYKQAENDLNKEKEQLSITEKSAQLVIEEQESKLDFFKEELKSVQIQQDRVERLYKEKISTLSDFEDTKRTTRAQQYLLDKETASLEYTKSKSASDGNKIKTAISFSENRVFKAKNDYEKAKNEFEKAIIKAPADGILIYQNVRKGGGEQDKLMQGDNVRKGNHIMKIAQSDALIVNAEIKTSDIPRMKLGQIVSITPDSAPDSILEGTVTKIASISSENWRGNTGKYPIEIEVTKNIGKILKPGMQVTAEATLKDVKNALTVPIECIYRDLNNIYVWVKTDKGTFIKQNITVSDRNEKSAVVTSGLNAGSKVALHDPNIEEDDLSESKPKPKLPGAGEKK